jgi:hypothetical protein
MAALRSWLNPLVGVLCPLPLPAGSHSIDEVIELAELIRPTGMPFGVELTLCNERCRKDVA